MICRSKPRCLHRRDGIADRIPEKVHPLPLSVLGDSSGSVPTMVWDSGGPRTVTCGSRARQHRIPENSQYTATSGARRSTGISCTCRLEFRRRSAHQVIFESRTTNERDSSESRLAFGHHRSGRRCDLLGRPVCQRSDQRIGGANHGLSTSEGRNAGRLRAEQERECGKCEGGCERKCGKCEGNCGKYEGNCEGKCRKCEGNCEGKCEKCTGKCEKCTGKCAKCTGNCAKARPARRDDSKPAIISKRDSRIVRIVGRVTKALVGKSLFPASPSRLLVAMAGG